MSNNLICNFSLDLLYHNITMHILHTSLYTFPLVLTSRIMEYLSELLLLVIIAFILMTLKIDLAV